MSGYKKGDVVASIFSQIIEGVIPCHKIYEDEWTLAFLDIHPEVMGHVLVVPKVEVDKIYNLEDSDFLNLMKSVKKVSKQMEKVLGERVIWKVIGTDVPHTHVHVMPLSDSWEYGKTLTPTEEEMEKMQKRLSF